MRDKGSSKRGRGIASNSSRFTKEANAGSLGTIVASPLPCSGTWAGSRCQTSRGFFGSGVCPTADLNNWDADSTTRLAGELGIELSCSRCDQPESWTSFVTRESTDGGTASRGVGPQRAMRSFANKTWAERLYCTDINIPHRARFLQGNDVRYLNTKRRACFALQAERREHQILVRQIPSI
mmetsp:Transcript_12827/g.28831  ORF Transcript_12827/g.28831 Transcript_12827/m.28831 type:complete len:181 (-) Transcript_12827:365-907(-)